MSLHSEPPVCDGCAARAKEFAERVGEADWRSFLPLDGTHITLPGDVLITEADPSGRIRVVMLLAVVAVMCVAVAAFMIGQAVPR